MATSKSNKKASSGSARKTVPNTVQKAVKATDDFSTEARIKAAAKKLFTERGFDGVKTRDIAEEAGINLALLNYYFRNKQKLFDIIVWENMQTFLGSILEYFRDSKDPMDQMLNFVAEKYIDMLIENPYLPFFVLQNLQNLNEKENEAKAVHPMFKEIGKMRAAFLQRVQASIDAGEIRPIHPLHFIANLMGLIVFPFVARNMLMSRIGNMTGSEFEALMQERKKLIPVWIKAMLAP